MRVLLGRMMLTPADPDAAMRAQAFITSSLRLLGFQGNPDHASHEKETWHPLVMTMSALHSQGVSELWMHILHFQQLQTANGRLQARRQAQAGDAGAAAAYQQMQALSPLLGCIRCPV